MWYTHELILIGGNSGEDALREYERLEFLLFEVGDGRIDGTLSPQHQVDARLVLVHRIQHQLFARIKIIMILRVENNKLEVILS